MKNTIHLSSSISLAVPSSRPRLRLPSLFVTVATLLLLLSIVSSSFANSATWKSSPATGDWNHAANWTPRTIPNGPSDTATFALSNTTGVSLSANTEVNGIVFTPSASAFTITVGLTLTLTISGTGITNNSGIAQEFVVAGEINGIPGTIQFRNGATAGNGTRIGGLESSGEPGGVTQFFDTSSAGNAEIANTIGSGGDFDFGGGTEFYDSSTAGNADVFNEGGRTFVRFFGNSTAGSGTFGNGGTVSFSDASTAGNGTFDNNNGAVKCTPCAASVEFDDTSTAGSGTFTNVGGNTGDGTPGRTDFFGSSSAGNGTFTCSRGQEEGGEGGLVFFGFASTAENGTFTLEGATDPGAGGGFAGFGDGSTAANATLIANGGSGGGGGGTIYFGNDSSGGTARVKVFGNGFLDISGHNAPGVATGSIQGSGLVFLGALNLTVGSNSRSTNFSGLIQDGGVNGGTGGSLTKIGTGKLVLTNANTYTGGTTIKHGKLLINNTSGSGTGSGPVQVNGGRLGGKGTIAGAVTVGTGISSGAVLSPGYQHGANKLGALTIESPLTFNADATYEAELNSSSTTADEVIANGVTINSGAQFSFADLGSGTLTPGTVFTVIDNTAATPIVGTFSNLPDGSMFTFNGNTYQVNYEGGDGNDLILTVVP